MTFGYLIQDQNKREEKISYAFAMFSECRGSVKLLSSGHNNTFTFTSVSKNVGLGFFPIEIKAEDMTGAEVMDECCWEVGKKVKRRKRNCGGRRYSRSLRRPDLHSIPFDIGCVRMIKC